MLVGLVALQLCLRSFVLQPFRLQLCGFSNLLHQDVVSSVCQQTRQACWYDATGGSSFQLDFTRFKEQIDQI